MRARLLGLLGVECRHSLPGQRAACSVQWHPQKIRCAPKIRLQPSFQGRAWKRWRQLERAALLVAYCSTEVCLVAPVSSLPR